MIGFVKRHKGWFQALVSAAVVFAINPWFGLGYYGVVALVWIACVIDRKLEEREEA